MQIGQSIDVYKRQEDNPEKELKVVFNVYKDSDEEIYRHILYDMLYFKKVLYLILIMTGGELFEKFP